MILSITEVTIFLLKNSHIKYLAVEITNKILQILNVVIKVVNHTK
jgi:hypothetical protein